MVLEKLGGSLKSTLQKIAKSTLVDEKLINELVKDIQRALLQADVNVQLVFKLTKQIKERAMKEALPSGLTKKEQLVNIVYQELVKFLGGEGHKIEVKKKPFKIMLAGLFGNGKTTTAAKLAKYFSKRGFKVGMLQTDTYRPAAYEQLVQLGKKINVPVFGNKEEKDAVKIYRQFESELRKFDLVILDTAGRDALSKDLIKELNQLNQAIKADERLLVIGADVGQAAKKQAEAFHDSCNITGVIITKLDGTAKGGGALIACSVTEAPVKFIGTGEKINELEEFKPQNFVGRILGMGDLEALLQKAKEAMPESQAEDLGKRFLKGDFNLIDLYEQMQAMRKMGPLGKVMEMVPGFGQLKMPKDMLKVQEEKLKKWKHIMNSCTKEELEDPDIITRGRIERIAQGSGTTTGEVRELLKQYKQSKKMVKHLKPGKEKDMKKMMRKFQGMKGMPGMGNMKFK